MPSCQDDVLDSPTLQTDYDLCSVVSPGSRGRTEIWIDCVVSKLPQISFLSLIRRHSRRLSVSVGGASDIWDPFDKSCVRYVTLVDS